MATLEDRMEADTPECRKAQTRWGEACSENREDTILSSAVNCTHSQMTRDERASLSVNVLSG